jgi:hypothetical protein
MTFMATTTKQVDDALVVVDQEYAAEMANLQRVRIAIRPHLCLMIEEYNARRRDLKKAHVLQRHALELLGMSVDDINACVSAQEDELKHRKLEFEYSLKQAGAGQC